MPCVTSNVVLNVDDSLTVIIPSLPTFSTASAIKEPIVSSLPADTVATCLIASEVSTGIAISSRLFAISRAACCIPFLIATALQPTFILFTPSLTIACVRIIVVVLPSPALSLAFDEASCTNLTPAFSIGSSNSTSLAIEIPSLII